MSILRRLPVANSPIPDQSEEFRKSGMVLITDPRADYYLNKVSREKKEEIKVNYLERFKDS